jgi:hypothetical protein
MDLTTLLAGLKVFGITLWLFYTTLQALVVFASYKPKGRLEAVGVAVTYLSLFGSLLYAFLQVLAFATGG